MIKITKEKTSLELKLEQIDNHLVLVENYAKGIAQQLNASMDVFWGCNDDLLLQIVNEKGPEEMERIFEAHAENATAINNLLALRGIAPIATIGMRKPLTLNEQGVFVLNYPPEQESETLITE